MEVNECRHLYVQVSVYVCTSGYSAPQFLNVITRRVLCFTPGPILNDKAGTQSTEGLHVLH